MEIFKKRLFFSFFVLLPFFACNNIGTTQSIYPDSVGSLPSLKIDAQNWGGDFTINIAQKQQISNDRIRYTLLSRYGDKPVGFYLDLREPGGNSTFVDHGVVLRPMGDTSNNFVAVLAQLYGVKRLNAVFADSAVATYVQLAEMAETKNPGNWSAAQKKLFFGDGSAEIYMNINPNEGTISFPEKDSANRADIVDAISRAIKK
jgi:hypothetical protein